MVVDDGEKKRKCAVFVPNFADLVHASHLQGFPNSTFSECAVAEIGANKTFFAAVLFVKCRTDGEADGACGNIIARVNTERRKGNVRGAAEPFIEARALAENFAKHTIEEIVCGKLFDGNIAVCGGSNRCERFAALISSHDMDQFIFSELFDRGKPLGKSRSVIAVCAEDDVLGCHAIRFTDSGSFFPDAKMDGGAQLVFDAVIFASFLEVGKHRFEFADHDHVMINTEKVSVGIDMLFVICGKGVTADGDIAEANSTACECFRRVYV